MHQDREHGGDRALGVREQVTANRTPETPWSVSLSAPRLRRAGETLLPRALPIRLELSPAEAKVGGDRAWPPLA